MSLELTPNQLVRWVHRLTHFVAWLAVAIFNISIAVAALAIMYFMGISGSDIRTAVQELSGSLGFETAGLLLSFFGVSGFAFVSFFAILQKRLLLDLSLRYILKNISKTQ